MREPLHPGAVCDFPTNTYRGAALRSWLAALDDSWLIREAAPLFVGCCVAAPGGAGSRVGPDEIGLTAVGSPLLLESPRGLRLRLTTTARRSALICRELVRPLIACT